MNNFVVNFLAKKAKMKTGLYALVWHVYVSRVISCKTLVASSILWTIKRTTTLGSAEIVLWEYFRDIRMNGLEWENWENVPAIRMQKRHYLCVHSRYRENKGVFYEYNTLGSGRSSILVHGTDYLCALGGQIYFLKKFIIEIDSFAGTLLLILVRYPSPPCCLHIQCARDIIPTLTEQTFSLGVLNWDTLHGDDLLGPTDVDVAKGKKNFMTYFLTHRLFID